MELFQDTALHVFWPACVILWTLIAVIQLWESTHKHRKAVATLAKRMDRLEKRTTVKRIPGKVASTDTVNSTTTGIPRLRVNFESGNVYEFDLAELDQPEN